MIIRKSRSMRRLAGMAGMAAAAGLALVTSAPVQAKAHCNHGKPGFGAGKFRNDTDQVIMVKGDKYIGDNKYKTVEVAIGRNGSTALQAGICDVDFIKTFRDFYYINDVVDGDSWRKITGNWACWNAPGSGYAIACGSGGWRSSRKASDPSR